jgi:glycosyltransferase 2 family protein
MTDGTSGRSHGGELRGWGPYLAVAGVLVASVLIYRAVSRYEVDEIIDSVTSIPSVRLLSAGIFAALSYICLTGFDWLALRYVRHPLPYRKAALASFTSLSLGHTIGIAFLSSGAIRYRFYTRWGLDAEAVAKVILFCGVTVALGLATLGGVSLLLRPAIAEELTGLSRIAISGVGVASLAGVAAYLIASVYVRSQIVVRSYEFSFPPLELAVGQVVVGSVNFACVAACLHQVVYAATQVEYLGLAAVYVTANATALMSHVPGGLGVIELVVMHFLPEGNLIGPLIAFRVLYFLLPLAIGGISLAATELYFGSAAR